ncbi:MAG: hypothetical protein MZV70_17570 [Desulfobacterales bacterium]|nr:hypothetical protein [Desulfobacterales bacterium]
MRSSQCAHARGSGSWLRVFVRTRTGDERKRHTVHFGIFRIEHPILVDRITAPPQPATDNLLAQQLRPERAARRRTCVTVLASQPSVSIETEIDTADALAKFARACRPCSLPRAGYLHPTVSSTSRAREACAIFRFELVDLHATAIFLNSSRHPLA